MARRRSRVRSPLRSPVAPRRRRSAPQLGPVSGMWFFLSSLCGLGAVLAQSLTVIAVCAITSVCGMVVGLTALFAPEKVGASTKVRPGPRKVNAPGKRAPSRRPASAGPKPRKRPKCSARCRNSKKDKSTCRCSCGGKTHGIGDGPASTTSASVSTLPTRSQLRSTRYRKAEKKAVGAERKASS